MSALKAIILVTFLFEMSALACNVGSFSCRKTAKVSPGKVHIYKIIFHTHKEEGRVENLAALAHRIVRSGYFTEIYRVLLMGRHYTSSLRKFTPRWAKSIYDTKIIQLIKRRS